MKPTAIAHSFLVSCCIAAFAFGGQQATAFNTKDDVKKGGAAVPTGDYRLGAGDKLRIEVYKDPQLSQSLQVRPDGKITLPLMGDIDAAGVTPIELRDTVTRQLKQYMNNPVDTVIVVEATAAAAYAV